MGCGVVERHLEMTQPTKKPTSKYLVTINGTLIYCNYNISFMVRLTVTLPSMVSVLVQGAHG